MDEATAIPRANTASTAKNIQNQCCTGNHTICKESLSEHLQYFIIRKCSLGKTETNQQRRWYKIKKLNVKWLKVWWVHQLQLLSWPNLVFQRLVIFVSVVTSVLLCFPLPSSHVLDNWEKCALTPQSWSVTLSGPGQDCGTSAPWSRTIWFEGRLKAESWISGQPVAWPFHPFFFFSLTVCVDGGGGGFRKRRAKPDQHQQTKESLLGINEIVVPVG